ncbi:CBS domain-containing protein [Adhaeretor mobilis]|uniref:Inosine 5'-monophosphate dehydrogenase n=1 Tax=Adhaeretor mobilis TaxID=1930276 RepID=A0A517MR38_9BACT|nr:CBS domain-containing protein [Adhaeretor mobilis]QDS97331.1 inosine 5'-monophosphate dehydrogenase [Adhaeretor mobilis]
MIVCPFCGKENTEGSDLCDDCQQSLTDVGLAQELSETERGLVKDRISSLNPNEPLAVSPSATIAEVLRTMVEKRIGCVMVVENDQLEGIFTERDALNKINIDAAERADRPISSVMTSKPVTLQGRDKIAFALHHMNLGGFRHIPILEGDKLTGVISIRDILGYLTDRSNSEQ